MDLFWLVQLLTLIVHETSSFSRCGAEQDVVSGNDSEGPGGQSLGSGANDIIVVRQSNGDLLGTPVSVQIGKLSSWKSVFSSRQGKAVQVVIEGQEFLPDNKLSVGSSGSVCFDRPESGDRFTKEELSRMNLKFGPNFGSYNVDSLGISVPFTIFLMGQSSRLVLTDIDGTITESNIRGFVYPQFGIDAHQDNVVELFQHIANNNYTVVYLTARSMAQDQATRQYLYETLQNQQGFSLPRGPLFMSPMPFAQSVVEAVTDPSVTKAATLRDILDLFEQKQDVVYGAYGNANTDTIAYMNVGIRPNLVYLVNKVGELRHVSDGTVSSYKHHAAMVDEMYPK